MFVCICNELRESACREAATDPVIKRAHCVYRRLGCRVRCGACLQTMQAIVEELKVERDARAVAPGDALNDSNELASIPAPGA